MCNKKVRKHAQIEVLENERRENSSQSQTGNIKATVRKRQRYARKIPCTMRKFRLFSATPFVL